jgi:D-inositol-3-phosphate glycosyltransferase
VLLFVGRIQPLKGAHVAVETLAQLRGIGLDASLVVIGGPSGDEGEATLRDLHERAKALRIAPHVYFRPPQAHELLSSYYRAADVTVVPSRSESFGLVALESLACGTPVVASAVGGLTTLVDDGRTGALVEGWDPVAYAKAVAGIIDEPIRATRYSTAAVLEAQRYTWRTTATQLSDLFSSLVARRLVSCS